MAMQFLCYSFDTKEEYDVAVSHIQEWITENPTPGHVMDISGLLERPLQLLDGRFAIIWPNIDISTTLSRHRYTIILKRYYGSPFLISEKDFINHPIPEEE